MSRRIRRVSTCACNIIFTALSYKILNIYFSFLDFYFLPNHSITYALLTTIGNLSYSVASDIGSAMTLIWDVSNETLESGDYSGLLKLTILTSCLQVAPLALVWLLPDSKEEQRKLQRCGITSYSAGLTLAIVIVASLLGTIAVSIYFIWY